MRQPTVSVAMATYNGERFLQEQLDSLARQTLLPCELVACDDGSTDGTLSVLHRFAERAPFPVRVFRNEAQLGPGFNFLGALGRCRGELVAFCDQDDVWLEEKLEVCTKALEDPDVTMVSHSAQVVSADGLPCARRHPDHSPTTWRRCRDLPVLRWTVPGFSIVLRRTVLDRARVPAYSDDVARWCTHDAWATMAALSQGTVLLLAEELAFYRLHSANVSLRAPAAGLKRLAPEPDAFEHRAESTLGSARFLRYAASFCDGTARRAFDECLGQTDRIQSLYLDRARLHRRCGHRLEAISVLAGMLAKREYGPRRLGAKAFARDAFLAAFWPAHKTGAGEADRAPAAKNT